MPPPFFLLLAGMTECRSSSQKRRGSPARGRQGRDTTPVLVERFLPEEPWYAAPRDDVTPGRIRETRKRQHRRVRGRSKDDGIGSSEKVRGAAHAEKAPAWGAWNGRQRLLDRLPAQCRERSWPLCQQGRAARGCMVPEGTSLGCRMWLPDALGQPPCAVQGRTQDMSEGTCRDRIRTYPDGSALIIVCSSEGPDPACGTMPGSQPEGPEPPRLTTPGIQFMPNSQTVEKVRRTQGSSRMICPDNLPYISQLPMAHHPVTVTHCHNRHWKS
ncbi:uncharacterized protein LOC114772215 [Denticeps clupeoides]|uniref:uncharacterized protein LOC114772215 n=1 Tax=Denticeps clupeoides TaxID=299321 RepID=UPI0010A3B5BE|nr:uncharacterized protein LOC114772215 [Denticeps clupeoides]